MKRTTLFAYLFGAIALAFASGASARPADGIGFVDENGDGINDIAAVRHSLVWRAYMQEQTTMRGQVDAQLSDEQKTELHDLVASLREEGATRETIHAAVTGKLTEFGVTLPEYWGLSALEYADAIGLTEDRRTELKTLVETMRSEGATRAEVRVAVDAQLAEWGIELPEQTGPVAGGPEMGRRGPHGFRGHRGPGAPTGDDAGASETTEAAE